jgi:hypothetical protein
MSRRHLPYLLLLFLGALSCTEKVDLELDDIESRLVIEAALSNTTGYQFIRITRSGSYFDATRAEPVSGAEITITDGSNTFDYRESSAGRYFSVDEIAGVPGTTYYLEARIEGETYTATSTMPPAPVIDSIKFELDEEEQNYYFVKVYSQEDPRPGNYYFWGVYLDNIYMTNSILKLYFASDNLINGSYLNGLKVQILKARRGNWVTLQMASITKEFYNYCIAIMRETLYTEDPFQAAPANIQGNISNGAFGFFQAFAEDEYSDILSVED